MQGDGVGLAEVVEHCRVIFRGGDEVHSCDHAPESLRRSVGADVQRQFLGWESGAAAFALRGRRVKLFQRRGCCLENSAHAMSYSPNVCHSPSETTSTESPITLMAVCSSMA